MGKSEATDSLRPVALTGGQKALVEALSAKDGRLGQMYRGALIALERSENPEALAQAAHSLRELMEKIPKWYEAVPAAEELPRLNDKVRALEVKWRNVMKKTSCCQDGRWQGTLDKPLTEALLAVESFFEWRATDQPMRNERTAGLLQKLDPLRLPLPSKIQELRVKEWVECRKYFVEVSHHREAAIREEFEQWLYFLERFLLDLIKPRTFEKHRDIDEIIEKGERDADS